MRDFFKIQLVVNPLVKKNHIFFRRRSMFLPFERIPYKHSSIFFYFVHLNVQNFRHIGNTFYFTIRNLASFLVEQTVIVEVITVAFYTFLPFFR